MVVRLMQSRCHRKSVTDRLQYVTDLSQCITRYRHEIRQLNDSNSPHLATSIVRTRTV